VDLAARRRRDLRRKKRSVTDRDILDARVRLSPGAFAAVFPL